MTDNDSNLQSSQTDLKSSPPFLSSYYNYPGVGND